MALRRARDFTFYPEYFDGTLSRAEGRRVSKDLAIRTPRAKELYVAAKRANLDATLDESKAYPRRWWERRGAITVKPTESKAQTQQKLVKALREVRIELLRKKKEQREQKAKKSKGSRRKR